MRFLGIALVIVSLPAFLALLRSSPAARGWLFVALGALPILQAPLNFNAALIDWATWPGHTRGIVVTLLDSVVLAICLRLGPRQPLPPLLWVFAIYFLTLIPGLFAGSLFTPAFFVLCQALRVTLVFYAVYLAILNGQLLRLADGMALAVIASGLYSGFQALSGSLQAPGLLGHQNITGLSTNLAIPFLLALGLRMNRPLLLAAVAAGAIGAVAGGSRATIGLYAFAVGATLLSSIAIKPTGKTVVLAVLGGIGLLAAAPVAISKLQERNATVFTTIDGEREAFERAARMMIEDHPWGVGLNQYVVVANTEGYLDRAGVRWGVSARATNVHNLYLLARAEGGVIGLAGLLLWLLVPIFAAFWIGLRRTTPLRETCMAAGVAIVAVAVHSRFEWAMVTVVPQYLMASMMAVVAALTVASRSTSSHRLPQRVETSHAQQATPSAVLTRS